jgi:nicotinate-nucleotide adenylyltransferase
VVSGVAGAGEAVALFGGSFNPPHVGHVLAVTYVLSAGLVDRVLVVPVFEHALGKHLAPFAHRLEMSRRAFGWLPNVEVSSLEERLGAPSRTLRTVQALEAEHPEWRLRLLVGSDITREIEKWHAFDEIVRRAPPLVLPRAGSGLAEGAPALLPEVSSTSVRQLLGRAARGEAVDAELAALVPKVVRDYIAEQGLYTSG